MMIILIHQDTFDKINGFTKEGDVILPRELSEETKLLYGFEYAVSINSFIKYIDQSITLIEEGTTFISIEPNPLLFPEDNIKE